MVYVNKFGIVGELIDNMEFTIESTVYFIIYEKACYTSFIAAI